MTLPGAPDQGVSDMGLIHIDLFTTLDLVAQAPGAPDEDAEGGFDYGGWQAPLFDDVVGEQVGAGMAGLDALLLGRKTYDIFAAYWPHQEQGVDAPISRLFNEVPKYVASRGQPGAGLGRVDPARVESRERSPGRARSPRERPRHRQGSDEARPLLAYRTLA